MGNAIVCPFLVVGSNINLSRVRQDHQCAVNCGEGKPAGTVGRRVVGSRHGRCPTETVGIYTHIDLAVRIGSGRGDRI